MTENLNDIEDLRLILDYKRAEAMNRIPLPDIEAERKRFWDTHADADSNQPENNPSPLDTEDAAEVSLPAASSAATPLRARRWRKWWFAAAAAAIVIIGISIPLLIPAPHDGSMQVFTADASGALSRLSIDGDDTFVIRGDRPDKELSAQGIIATKRSIDLSHARSNGKNHKLTLTTPCGQDYTVTLSDGTTVVLNAGSQLIFPDAFGAGNREVYLKGEAMFDVAHDPAHPFIVKTDWFDTRVLGTKFNLRSYSREDTHVTLLEGKVTVSKEQAPEVTLNPSEQASLSQSGEITKQKVDTYPYLEWQNGFFYFDNASLAEIMRELGRWYNVDVVFHNEKLLNYRIHFSASREEPLLEAVRNLNALGIFNVSLDGRRLAIQ